MTEKCEGATPNGCLKCDYKGSFERRIFEVNVEPENKLDEIQIEQIIKEKFNVSRFNLITGRGCYSTASLCPKCGSEEIFWDYWVTFKSSPKLEESITKQESLK